VVVAAGVTAIDPLVGMAPIPLSIVTDVALVVLQLRVAVCPAVIAVGFAVKLTVGSEVLLLTVTVAVAVFVPPAPVAVIV